MQESQICTMDGQNLGNPEVFRSAMFSLFPGTAWNLTLLDDQQLGEVIRALIIHYFTPEAGYTGANPLLEIIFRSACSELDRYTEKCEAKARSGRKPKQKKQKEATKKQNEAKEEQNGTQSQSQSQSHNKKQEQNQLCAPAQAPEESDEKVISDFSAAPTRESAQTLSQEFETFWRLYPRKQGKSAALKAYIKARQGGAQLWEIRAGIQRYAEYLKANRTEEKYIKHGSTWLLEQCWKDVYAQESAEDAWEASEINPDFVSYLEASHA